MGTHRAHGQIRNGIKITRVYRRYFRAVRKFRAGSGNVVGAHLLVTLCLYSRVCGPVLPPGLSAERGDLVAQAETSGRPTAASGIFSSVPAVGRFGTVSVCVTLWNPCEHGWNMAASGE
jgi:hypothetical protein